MLVYSSRYVNHSCAPNCVAEVVTFDKEDKIIIISSRRIPKGEEVSSSKELSFIFSPRVYPEYDSVFFSLIYV